MKIKWMVTLVGKNDRHEDWIELPDDTPQDEIEDIARQTALDHIEWSWWRDDEEKKS